VRCRAIRAFSGTAAVVLVGLLGAGPLTGPPAYADDPLPLPVVPSEVTQTPGFAGPTDTPQPNSARPSGQPGGRLSPPSSQQIEDARKALERLRRQGGGTPTTLAEVAGPTDEGSGSVTSRISDRAWWTIGAGMLVLLVVSETSRLTQRRGKHRKQT
jgi:hypothetical protein